MGSKIGEVHLEDAIELALVGSVAPAEPGAELAETRAPYGPPTLYQRRHSSDYDKTLCLIEDDVVDFVVSTQPKAWQRLGELHGDDVRKHFLRRLASEIDKRGTLEVLRQGIKDSGVAVRLAYFKPHSGLNEDLQRLYEANVFTLVRQLYYSEREPRGEKQKSLDVVLFLNGLPLFTAELKNPLSGQDVKDAIHQYETDRDPAEPLFAFGRCLAHFAVDPDLVYVSTHIKGKGTHFLPFNQGGDDGGAGNPTPSLTNGGYKTGYLWEEVWARDSVLELIQRFIHRIQKPPEAGQKTGKQVQLFPRYHQLDAVRRLVTHARKHGVGHQYLIQHSAGSGKSLTIGWLAHWLSVLHDKDDRRVFDSIIVLTDRRVLDQQLQETVRQLEQTLGVVENIDTTSKQLQQALEEGKTIIVTTLQKFPVIVDSVRALPGKRFALIVDEAHSSQSGETSKALKTVLAGASLEEAEAAEAGEEEEDLEDRVAEVMRTRGRLPNASTFAFTATPKDRTLELFGRKNPETGRYEPFSLYSMRQAIEENFILDVLKNYTTYQTYWKLLKTVEDDPHYDKAKAKSLLKSFVELHDHSIKKKVEIVVAHFREHVQHRIGGRAKAMVVTRSRLHCVRFQRALVEHLEEQGLPYRSLIAFSGAVEDGGDEYTEGRMNGFPDSQTRAAFERPENRFLVVANKYQTGFDQPLLHTMYVDKRLGGVNAVQTLSRLNRTFPGKEETMVLDFANEASTIQAAFEPYYETTVLSEGTDPNVLYDRQHELMEFGVFTMNDVNAFAEVFFREKPQEQVYLALEPVRKRAESQLTDDEMRELRSALDGYARLYAFLSQILSFADNDLEMLYEFCRLLRRLLHAPDPELPKEVQEQIDMDSLRVDRTFGGDIALERGRSTLEPRGERRGGEATPEAMEPLSRIIQELNERYGANLGPEDHVTLGRILDQAEGKDSLRLSVENNTEENARLAFELEIKERLQDIIDTNFKLYKRIAEDRQFADHLMADLFDQYRRRVRSGSVTEARVREEIAEGEDKHREFKSTLRWNVYTEKNDPAITKAVLKTIAAFQNTDGGVLYIGVADDGTAVGIERDGFPSGDRFLLHLVNVAKAALGPAAAAKLDVRLWLLDGHEVCRVECPPSPQPVFYRYQGEESFFVRSGPSTEALGPAEMHGYIKDRFPG